MFSIPLFLLLSVISLSSSLQEIPPFLLICKKNSPDLNECVRKSIETLRPQLQHGNVEYNIPSVEPIIINDLIKEDSGGLKIETTDVVARGGGNFEVTDIKIDIDGLIFDVDILVPALTIDAKYRLDGKLVMLPVHGDGGFYGNLTNCRGQSRLVGKIIEKNGEKHMEFVENKMKITVGDGKVRFDNLFNGDKTINKLINDAVNDNFQSVFKEIVPYVERGLAKNFMNTGNQIITPYTYDQLFPE